eukprot:1180212-Prorocentrum_minimum.AAC.3
MRNGIPHLSPSGRPSCARPWRRAGGLQVATLGHVAARAALIRQQPRHPSPPLQEGAPPPQRQHPDLARGGVRGDLVPVPPQTVRQWLKVPFKCPKSSLKVQAYQRRSAGEARVGGGPQRGPKRTARHPPRALDADLEF